MIVTKQCVYCGKPVKCDIEDWEIDDEVECDICHDYYYDEERRKEPRRGGRKQKLAD
jgi:hypothetical protein